jgi:hypothetical protein
MFRVVSGQRSDAIGTQELLLVEYSGQHAVELRLVQHRSKAPARMTQRDRIMDERPQLRARLEDPAKALVQVWLRCKELPVEGGDRTQGERAHTQSAQFIPTSTPRSRPDTD